MHLFLSIEIDELNTAKLIRMFENDIIDPQVLFVIANLNFFCLKFARVSESFVFMSIILFQ